MQAKYIVYYPQRGQSPKVAVWLTDDGSMLHTKYAEEHHIDPLLYSSVGYIYYSPELKKYQLEYHPRKEADTLLEFIQQKKIEVRDRKLVLKEISQNPLFKQPHVMTGTYQDWITFQKARQNCRVV